MAKIIQPLTNTQVEKAKYITGNKAELKRWWRLIFTAIRIRLKI